ncbi:hypothetical protein BD309DRAFT_983901 [Dichomitus squalens]|uniref:Uncharacterized protein n=1 Tax=Dichomitus squalens TaxID=114155 RepID=A0A4Q9NF83_9APHY|nr:hypothetical protein BD309DRAFT_983901 [Dichomitus squalens]TBU54703.1 hypothetical protein BD310DRAFT_935333 [Dichomitus squalens]
MAIIVLSPLTLALICFTVLAFVTGCAVTAAALVSRRQACPSSSTVVDVEAQPQLSVCSTSTEKPQDSTTASITSSKEPCELTPTSLCATSIRIPALDTNPDKVSMSDDSMLGSSEDAKATSRHGTAYETPEQDRYTTIPRRSSALAKAKAKARARQTLSLLREYGISLGTPNDSGLCNDVILHGPPEPTVAVEEPSSDPRALALADGRLTLTPEATTTSPELPSSNIKELSPALQVSSSASLEHFRTSSEPLSASVASTPSLTSAASTPSNTTSWEVQTPPTTSIAGSLRYDSFPTLKSLEMRSVPVDAVVLAPAGVLLASGSFPSCVSGISEIFLSGRDLASPTYGTDEKLVSDSPKGLGFDVTTSALPVSSELGVSSAHSSAELAEAQGPLYSASPSYNIASHGDTTFNVSLASDADTAWDMDASEMKSTISKRYSDLLDALTTSFSITSLKDPRSNRSSMSSVSASSSASSAANLPDPNSGLDLYYDASESDMDSSYSSEASEDVFQADPERLANHTLHESCSYSMHPVLAL